MVEIFIRANSGGTRLGKSDLLFSLLTSSWDEADDKMEMLLDELNKQGFAFSRDFILKTRLTLLDQGARYEVEKFRKAGVRENIEGKWDDIIAATKEVADFVAGQHFYPVRQGLAVLSSPDSARLSPVSLPRQRGRRSRTLNSTCSARFWPERSVVRPTNSLTTSSAR